jgi:hypothetical protein
MPILGLSFGGGGASSVPDATTTTAGKVRLATIAEASGTSELIAVTPAGLQAELAGIVGGMEFKGAYDIGIGVPDLTTGSTKAGDFYVVTNVKLNPSDTNTTKELYGQEWAVGDHLVVTRDIASGETDYNDAISKIDNSESISVLTDLLDVAISAEADGQVLVYDGTGEEWVNRELTVADVLNAVTQADHDALATRVTTNEGDISSIDGRLTTAEGEINALQLEMSTTQSNVGLNANGTYTPDPTATYISTATTLKQADSLLDDQVKANADAISAAQTVSSDIQSEINATQSGAGLTSGGAYIVDGDANYIASATNLADADTLLDAKLKETRDIVDNLGANSVASVNGVSPVSGDVTVGGADIDTAHTATNYTASTADLDAHLSGVDTELGALQTQITSNDGDISALDGRVTVNEGDITALDGRLTTAEGEIDDLQTELDATQQGAGLETNGAYVANVSTNYIGGVSSLKGADEALDAKLKETRDLVDNLGANSVASVNGVSPVAGDVTVGGADIDTAHTASDYTAAAADIDSHLAGIDTRLSEKANSADLADIATSGAASDASVTATPTEYSAATADVEAHLVGIDTRLADKANSADLASIATSGAASDASVTATPTNYTSASADVEAHLAGIDTALGANLITTVNGVAGVDGDVTVGGADIDSAHVATNYTASAADLDSHFSGVDDALALKANDADVVKEVNSLTPTDGALTLGGADIETAHTASDYTASAADLDSHIAGIDSRLADKANSADLADIATSGAASDASVVATPTNYTSATADVEAHLVGIDAKLGTLGGASVVSVNGVSPVSGDVTVGGADIDSAHSAVNYTASAADLDSHLSGVDTELGTLASDLSTESTARADGDSALQGELDATQQGAGLETNGAYVANGSTNYLGTATSLKDADEALDTELALKANIASPALTGTPTAPTASLGTNTTQIATTAFVASELNALSTTATGAEGVIQVSDGSAGFAAGQWSLNATSGAFLPDGNNTRDIGSASARAKDAYLNALKVGASQLSVSIDGTSGRLIAGGGATALTADSAELVLSSDLATVATSGDYGDLSNAPTSFINSATFITDADALTLESGKHYIIGTATGSTKTMTLPSVTNNGEYIRVTNWGLGELLIQVDQADTNAYLLVGQNITLNGQVTVESKATVDLFGFNYSQGGTDYQPAWGCYFASSIELNTRSFTTDGQLPVYDATKQELYAGDLGDLSLSFSATNYDETRGATVDGTKVIHHLGGIDDELGALDTALTTLDGEAVKTVNALTPTAGAVVLGGADIETAHTAVNYTAASADLDAHLAGLDTEVGLAINSVNTLTPTDGALTLGGADIETAHTASDYTAAAADLDSHLAGIDTRLSEKVNIADGLDGLADVDLTTVAVQDGEILIYNATSEKWEPNPPPAPLATETSVGLVEYATDAETTAGTADNVVLRPSNIASIEISSLLNAGTAATADTGTAIGDVVVLEDVDGSAGLPAVDGSQLTGVTTSAPPVTAATGGTITVPTGSEAVWIMSPTADATVTLSSPTAGGPGTGDDGKKLAVKNFSAFELTLSGSIDGAASFVMAAENSALTLVAYDGGWYIV